MLGGLTFSKLLILGSLLDFFFGLQAGLGPRQSFPAAGAIPQAFRQLVPALLGPEERILVSVHGLSGLEELIDLPGRFKETTPVQEADNNNATNTAGS